MSSSCRSDCLNMDGLHEEFPWLGFHLGSGTMYCKPCVDSGMDCYFSLTEDKEVLKKHAICDRHIAIMGLSVLLQGHIPSTGPMFSWNKSQPFEHIKQEEAIPSPDCDQYSAEGSSEDESPSAEAQNDTDGHGNEISTSEADLSGQLDSEMQSVVQEDENCVQAKIPNEANTSQTTNKEHRVRRFCNNWLQRFPWLIYDKDRNIMFCKYCLKYCQQSNANSFVKGACCFRLASLSAHAGSVDHQMAEKADKLLVEASQSEKQPSKTITAKQKFLLQKYLRLFPWLVYRSDVQMITCEICQKHTKNTLFIDVTSELDYEVIRRHANMQYHLVSEETEVKSWSVAWDTLTARGIDGDTIGLEIDPFRDLQRRSASLFRDTSVKISGTDHEIALCNKNLIEVEQTNFRDHFISESGTVTINSNLISSDIRNLPGKGFVCSPRRSVTKGIYPYVKKKPSLLPAFGTFKTKWLTEFPWLKYDVQHNLMKCGLCEKHQKKMGFAVGVRVFSRSYIVAHMGLLRHKQAVKAEGLPIDESTVKKKRKRKRTKSSKRNMDNSDEYVPTEVSPDCDPSDMDVDVNGQSTDISIKSEPSVEPSSTNNENIRKSRLTSPKQVIMPIAPQNNKKVPQKTRRTFNSNWIDRFPWVEYDANNHSMTCIWCLKHNFNSAFTRGSSCFHIDSLRTHDGSMQHQQAAHMELLQYDTSTGKSIKT